MNGQKKMKTIMLINLFKFTGDDIGKLREKNKSYKHLEKLLPEYCLNRETGKIVPYEAGGYLQFVFEGEIKYWLFDIVGMDTLLAEEISNAGIEEVITKDLRPLFEHIGGYKGEDYFRVIPISVPIIIDLDYDSRQYESDYGIDYKLVGYLNDDLTLIKYEDILNESKNSN